MFPGDSAGKLTAGQPLSTGDTLGQLRQTRKTSYSSRNVGTATTNCSMYQANRQLLIFLGDSRVGQLRAYKKQGKPANNGQMAVKRRNQLRYAPS